jgi:hypothetical protein
MVTTVDGRGKRRKISLWEAIVKQCGTLAAQGDMKATGMVLRMPKPQRAAEDNGLSPLLQEFRAINARHAAIPTNSNPPQTESGDKKDDDQD